MNQYPYQNYYAYQNQYPQFYGGAAQANPQDPYYSYYAQGYQSMPPSFTSGWLDFQNPQYLKGLLLAAGVTLLVANPKVQKTVLKGLAKAWSGLQYGIEEVKEQINDIKAELHYKQEMKASAKEEPADA